MWDKYDEATMGIAVRHIRRYYDRSKDLRPAEPSVSSALPDYVFDEGERQPRSQKRPKTKVRPTPYNNASREGPVLDI